ncbi:hypothetical protein [Rubritalea sp.]
MKRKHRRHREEFDISLEPEVSPRLRKDLAMPQRREEILKRLRS